MEAKNYRIYYSFLNKLARELTSFYFKKINKTFSVTNKHKGRGYDPVTSSDRAFEKFIRSKISKKFPGHQYSVEKLQLGIFQRGACPALEEKFKIPKANVHKRIGPKVIPVVI